MGPTSPEQQAEANLGLYIESEKCSLAGACTQGKITESDQKSGSCGARLALFHPFSQELAEMIS